MTNAKYVGTSSPSPLLSSSAFAECGVDGVDGFEDRAESFGRLCEAEPGVRMRAEPCPRFEPCGLPPTDSGTVGSVFMSLSPHPRDSISCFELANAEIAKLGASRGRSASQSRGFSRLVLSIYM